MDKSQTIILDKACEGDINAFNQLFTEIKPKLESYIYRMTADIIECEDLVHDVFIKAFENIKSFRREASLKTWIFTIATNHVRRLLKNRKRWEKDTAERTRIIAHDQPEWLDALHEAGKYEIKEHIDYCFTCITRMLKLEEQMVVLLKEIYRFKIRETAEILGFTESKTKHLLRNGKSQMLDIFDYNCALISKTGYCAQCSGLNGMFNPKEDAQEKLMQLEMITDKKGKNRDELLELRLKLCRGIDMLQTEGSDLHAIFFKLAHCANAK